MAALPVTVALQRLSSTCLRMRNTEDLPIFVCGCSMGFGSGNFLQSPKRPNDLGRSRQHVHVCVCVCIKFEFFLCSEVGRDTCVTQSKCELRALRSLQWTVPGVGIVHERLSKAQRNVQPLDSRGQRASLRCILVSCS